ncbi:MAG: DUF192 domain-containing protein, partial [Actinobacteria bacterium]|nr:DUF192 domain-containing protein [Actinomycetota bacterium]
KVGWTQATTPRSAMRRMRSGASTWACSTLGAAAAQSRRGVWVVLALGVLALLVRGADGPPDPYLVPAEAEDAGAGEETELSAGAAAVPDEDGGAGAVPPEAPGPATPTATPPDPGPAMASPTASTTTAAEPPPAPARRPLPGFGETDFRITSGDGGTFHGVALLADDGPSRSQGLMEQTDLRGYDAMVFRFDSPTTGEFYMRNTRIPLSIAFFDAGGRFVSSADMEPCPDEVRRCPTYGADRPYLHAIEVPAGDLGRMGIGPGAVLSFP